MRRTAFDNFHPAVPALYFAFVLIYCMTAFHPVLVAMSLASGLAANAYLRGVRATARTASWQIPLMLVIALVNPLVSASGSTLLFVVGPFPIYLESFAYGLCMGAMLMATMLWFSNAAAVMTSENVTALTGARLPVIGLMLSMIMRLVPQFVRRGQLVGSAVDATSAARCVNAGPTLFSTCPGEDDHPAQVSSQGANCSSTSTGCLPSPCSLGAGSTCPGEDDAQVSARGETRAERARPVGVSHGASTSATPSPCSLGAGSDSSSKKRARFAPRVRQLSVLMGWSMEDSLDTADAMRARGWGATARRTTYQRRALDVVDVALVVAFCALAACVTATTVAMCAGASFYPVIDIGSWWWLSAVAYAVVLAIPCVMEVREWLSWR